MKNKIKIIIISSLAIILSICYMLPVHAYSDDDIIIKGGGVGTPNDCHATDAQCHNSQLPASSSDNIASADDCLERGLDETFCKELEKCGSTDYEKCVYYNEAPNTFGSTGGVRLTIVNDNGDRISGTHSIDLTRKNMHLGCGFNCKNLELSNLNYEMEFGNSVAKENKKSLLTYPGKMDRNEVRKYGFQHGDETLSVPMYYWKDLPWLYNTGDSDTLNNFLKNLSPDEYEKIFKLMNYTTYNAWSSSQDVYLQIEPTTYLSLARTEDFVVKKLDRYYGTVSEVASMLEQANKWIYKYFWTDVFPLSVYNQGYGKIAGYNMFSSAPSPHKFGVYGSNEYNFLNDEFLSDNGYAIGSWKIKDLTPEPCNFDYYSYIPYSCNVSNNALIQDRADNIFSSCMFKANKSALFSNRSSAEQNYIRQYYNPEGSTTFDTNPYCKVVCTDKITYAFPTKYPNNELIVNAGQRYTIGISGSPSNPEILKNSLNPMKFRSVSTCRTGFAQDEDVPSNATHGQINYEQFKTDWINNESYKQSLWNSGNYARYKVAVDKGLNMLAQLMTCNNFQRTESGFEPKVSYSAEPNTIYNYTYTLKSIVTFDESSTTYYNSSNNSVGSTNWNTSGYENDTLGFTSSGSNFKKDKTPNVFGNYSTLSFFDKNHVETTIQYPTNDWVEQKTNKLIYYTLPDNVYRFQDQSSGISYSDENEIKQKQHSYTTTNYSNLPIPYQIDFKVPFKKTDDGTYIKDYLYAFDFYYSNTNGTMKNLFGTKNRFYNGDYLEVFKPGAKRKFGDTNLTISNLHYECDYKISSGKFKPEYDPDCDPDTGECHDEICIGPGCKPGPGDHPKTSDLIAEYRPISLTDPFPGQEGKGRTYGKNWDGKTSTGESYVDAYIKKNRGVTGDEVYNLEPMYEFVLNSSSIKAIREYNKVHSYDDTISLSCDDKGSYCISDFVRNGINNNYFKFKDTSGTCFNATKLTWESCRYTTSETYTNPLLNMSGNNNNSNCTWSEQGYTCSE